MTVLIIISVLVYEDGAINQFIERQLHTLFLTNEVRCSKFNNNIHYVSIISYSEYKIPMY